MVAVLSGIDWRSLESGYFIDGETPFDRAGLMVADRGDHESTRLRPDPHPSLLKLARCRTLERLVVVVLGGTRVRPLPESLRQRGAGR